jgi:hypothetical protein
MCGWVTPSIHTHIYADVWLYTRIYPHIYEEIRCKELAFQVMGIGRHVLSIQGRPSGRSGWNSKVQVVLQSVDAIFSSSGKPQLCSEGLSAG